MSPGIVFIIPGKSGIVVGFHHPWPTLGGGVGESGTGGRLHSIDKTWEISKRDPAAQANIARRLIVEIGCGKSGFVTGESEIGREEEET